MFPHQHEASQSGTIDTEKVSIFQFSVLTTGRSIEVKVFYDPRKKHAVGLFHDLVKQAQISQTTKFSNDKGQLVLNVSRLEISLTLNLPIGKEQVL